MELLPDEKIIMQDDAKSDFFGKGILYMTNVRILLDVKTGGFLSKTTEIKLDKALGSIKEVSLPEENSSGSSLKGALNRQHSMLQMPRNGKLPLKVH